MASIYSMPEGPAGYVRRLLRKSGLLVGATAAVVLLFGLCACSASHFDSQGSAERYVTEALSKKYGEDFQITEVINYKEEPIGIKWISAKATSSGTGLDATIYARDTGSIEDDYHVHFFEDAIIEEVASLCGEQEVLELDAIEVDGDQSATRWSEDAPVEDYIDADEYKIDVIATVVPGSSDEEVAEAIRSWASSLSEWGHDIQLTVLEGEDIVIFTEDVVRMDAGEELSIQNIIIRMNEWRGTAETLQHYEQWKAERA